MAKYVLDYGPTAVSGIPIFTIFRNVNTGEDLISLAPTPTYITSGCFDFTWSSGIVLQFRSMLGDIPVMGVVDQSDGDPDQGEGPIRIDHNYGGTDNYRVFEVQSSSPLASHLIAYLAEDFSAGRTRLPSNIRGETRTGSDGRWLEPMWLDIGDYTIAVVAPGHQHKSFNITVVA